MLKERVISDFDGLWTDVNKEAKKYTSVFAEKVSEKIRLGINEFHDLMEDSRETILQSPGVFGWESNGIIVAPATADPYIFNQVAARLTLNKLREEKAPHIPTKEEAVQWMHQLFRECSPLMDTVFREGAREFLEELHQETQLTIVTNSQTETVEEKLFKLFGSEDHGLRVVGNAKKYIVNNRGNWTVDKTTQLSGLPRPVFLRRPNYNKLVKELGPVDDVLGDIYELDLSLPEAKGITTVLFVSSTTPIWEVEHYRDHPNGFSATSLGEMTDRVLSK